ncbi:hypothetical protein LEP48_12585 [Isoptericola sp. NEAU-Y5]|uniref:Uncharacterized protein n=1 Tax=Isoptericola luteus TaxID=2879484 RepID=A0ABS7ZI77_9MICO|nr:hypothetical protein [Isoptericola sp. NEAU-Y5]MCA5894177.1 hypothetical protein [Isoptericola sp. NEAU-Y5]
MDRARPTYRGHVVLLVVLVVLGCGVGWGVGIAVLSLMGRPVADGIGRWSLVLIGAVVLVGLLLGVVSLLRGPRVIVVRDPAAGEWSLRSRPVPFRFADSSMLDPGSPGFVLARQVARAAAGAPGDAACTVRAVHLLRRVVELSRRSHASSPVVGDVEWARLRIDVVNFVHLAGGGHQSPGLRDAA